MFKSFTSLMDSVTLINALVLNETPSKQHLERLARNYKHLKLTLEKPEVINSGQSLTEYRDALERGADYLRQRAPQLLN